MEHQDNSQWVASHLSLTKPAWEPDVAKARLVLEERITSQPRERRWLIPAASLAALALAVLAIPQGRAIAQEVWFRLFLDRVEVIRVDPSNLPFETNVAVSGAHKVAGLEEAETQAGFRPDLPSEAAWPGPPSLRVVGAITINHTIRTKKLRAALERAGAADVVVPDQWDQAVLRVSIGPLVEANYAGEIQILQAKPAQVLLPAGIPLEQLAEATFRSAGLPWAEARAMARRFAAQPSMLLGIPSNEAAKIEEVKLRLGSGMLVEELDDNSGETVRATLVIANKDRVFAVMSPSREVCLRVADQLTPTAQ